MPKTMPCMACGAVWALDREQPGGWRAEHYLPQVESGGRTRRRYLRMWALDVETETDGYEWINAKGIEYAHPIGEDEPDDA